MTPRGGTPQITFRQGNLSETLEPCPWCGGTDLTDDWTSGGYRWMHVWCRCGACGPGVAMNDDYDAVRAEARAAWNRRADDARGQPEGWELCLHVPGPGEALCNCHRCNTFGGHPCPYCRPVRAGHVSARARQRQGEGT